jgi:hypothetical protein
LVGDSVGGVTLLTHQWGYDIMDAIKIATGMETYVFYVDSAVLGKMLMIMMIMMMMLMMMVIMMMMIIMMMIMLIITVLIKFFMTMMLHMMML